MKGGALALIVFLVACGGTVAGSGPPADGGSPSPEAGLDGTDASDAANATDDASSGPGDADAPDACGDLQNDPLHCGACNVSCGSGSACQNGICGPKPSVFASGQMPYWVAADASHVYWVDIESPPPGAGGDSQVLECPVTGCSGAPITLWNALYPAGPLAIEQGSVWWPAGQGPAGTGPNGAGALPQVMSCAVGGCGGAPATLLSVDLTIRYFATSATTAFWSPIAGSVYSCALGGCGGVPTTLYSGTAEILALAASGTGVYWADSTGSILACPTAGCAGGPSILLPGAGVGYTSLLAVDATRVYWVDPGTPHGGGKNPPTQWSNGAIYSCPLTGCGAGPTVLAMYPVWLAAGALSVDSNYVYWTMEDASGSYGEVVRCAVGGCGQQPTAVATTATSMPTHGLALGGGRVFWTDFGLHAVMTAPE